VQPREAQEGRHQRGGRGLSRRQAGRGTCFTGGRMMELRAEGVSRLYIRQGKGKNFFFAVQKKSSSQKRASSIVSF